MEQERVSTRFGSTRGQRLRALSTSALLRRAMPPGFRNRAQNARDCSIRATIITRDGLTTRDGKRHQPAPAPIAAAMNLANRSRSSGEKRKPSLRAPPQHVVLGLRPFPFHQIAHLRRREVGAKAGSEILEPPRRPEHALEARPVGAHQAPRVRLAQERPRSAGLGDERLDAVMGKLSARQVESAVQAGPTSTICARRSRACSASRR